MLSSPNLALLSRKMEVLENERYNPLAGGWGSGGLLPTDRKPLSNGAGTAGWSTMKEVEDALLSAGWRWDNAGSWDVVCDESTDDAGWSYAPDFGWYETKGGEKKMDGAASRVSVSGQTVFTNSLQEGAEVLAFPDQSGAEGLSSLVGGAGGVPVKQMMHFVRRRKRARFQTFDPEALTDFGAFTCDHCDLEEIERVSAVLLNALAAATLRAHPRNLTEAKCNKLKSALIERLALRSGDLVASGLYSAKLVASRLEEFSKGSGSAWSAMSGMVASASGSPLEMLGRRTADIAHAFFSHEERRILAGLVIRRHDANFEYHCSLPKCGAACEYRVEQCPNHACGIVFSHKWRGEHDAICPQKTIVCERSCGDSCLRRLMKTHLSQACPLRPAACPYHDLGCMTELTHKDVPGHVESCMPSHLLLSLARIQEQQGVIKDLHQRMGELEAGQAKLGQTMAAAAAGVTAAMTAIDVLANRSDKALREEAAAQAKKTAAVASEVHGHSSTLTKHASDIASLNKSISEIKPFLAALGAKR